MIKAKTELIKSNPRERKWFFADMELSVTQY